MHVSLSCKRVQERDKHASTHVFHKSALSSGVILRLAHVWLGNVKHTSDVMLTGHSSATVSSFYAYFRQLVT